MRVALVAVLLVLVVGAGMRAATPQATAASQLGTIEIRNSSGRSGSYYVPNRTVDATLPILVALHGTGDSGRAMVTAFRELADARGFVVVAPDSRRSPAGQLTWQVGDFPSEVTEDLTHVLACLDEVAGDLGQEADASEVLIVGYSGGGSAAPYIATNRGRFSAFGVLHGGVFAGGLGPHRVRGWFSTGTQDPARPPAQVKEAFVETGNHGVGDLTLRVFPGGHGLSPAERAALIEWWLTDAAT
jgi:poly(3-hydroxybutyrate) depolymerase